jgi:hypothetical protein
MRSAGLGLRGLTCGGGQLSPAERGQDDGPCHSVSIPGLTRSPRPCGRSAQSAENFSILWPKLCQLQFLLPQPFLELPLFRPILRGRWSSRSRETIGRFHLLLPLPSVQGLALILVSLLPRPRAVKCRGGRIPPWRLPSQKPFALRPAPMPGFLASQNLVVGHWLVLALLRADEVLSSTARLGLLPLSSHLHPLRFQGHCRFLEPPPPSEPVAA